MPTRFYLPSTGTPPASPAFDATWSGRTGSAVRLPMRRTKAGTALESGTTFSGAYNTARYQFISEDTFTEAKAVAGTFSAVFRVGSQTTNGFLQMVVKVVSGDGATVRGTLVAAHNVSSTSSTADARNQSLPSSTAYETRVWKDIAASSVTVQPGDRLLIEVGVRWPSGNGYNAGITVGDAAGTDYPLAAGQADAGGILDPWVEFSEDLFGAAAPPAGSLEGTAPAVVGSFAAAVAVASTTATLAGTAPTVTGSFAGGIPDAITAELSGQAPAVFGDFAGTAIAGAQEATTDAVDRSNGRTRVCEWTVEIEPPVTSATRDRGHDEVQTYSISGTTLVDGRPT